MHKNQTYQFVKDKTAEWCRFDHAEMTMMEALDMLSSFIDECDPDVDVPNAVHAYQTAEGMTSSATSVLPQALCLQTYTQPKFSFDNDCKF